MTQAVTWRELTERNKQTLRSILHGLDPADRIRMMELATKMIENDHFESVSAKWNAFQNALSILVAALGE